MAAAVQRLRGDGGATRDVERPSIGRLAGIDPDGRLLVELPGSRCGPVQARFVPGAFGSVQGALDSIGCEVVLFFEDADPARPVVIGVVRDRLRELTPVGVPVEPSSRPRTALLDGRRVVLDAEDEIVLQCGKGSLTLTADGRVVIKGTEIVSRALRAHKIRGGTVNIN